MSDLTPKVAWVYELRWPDTNEIYIGSTSQHPEKRFKAHKGRPHKCYEHLGIENAKLAFCYPYEPKHNMDRDEEKRWKEVSRNYGYIVLDDGDKYNTLLRQPDEVKHKLARAQKIAQNRPETNRKRREAQGHAFTCTDPQGRVTHYQSLTEAAVKFNVSHSTIDRYLKGITIPGSSKHSAHLKGCIFTYI